MARVVCNRFSMLVSGFVWASWFVDVFVWLARCLDSPTTARCLQIQTIFPIGNETPIWRSPQIWGKPAGDLDHVAPELGLVRLSVFPIGKRWPQSWGSSEPVEPPPNDLAPDLGRPPGQGGLAPMPNRIPQNQGAVGTAGHARARWGETW